MTQQREWQHRYTDTHIQLWKHQVRASDLANSGGGRSTQNDINEKNIIRVLGGQMHKYFWLRSPKDNIESIV